MICGVYCGCNYDVYRILRMLVKRPGLPARSIPKWEFRIKWRLFRELRRHQERIGGESGIFIISWIASLLVCIRARARARARNGNVSCGLSADKRAILPIFSVRVYRLYGAVVNWCRASCCFREISTHLVPRVSQRGYTHARTHAKNTRCFHRERKRERPLSWQAALVARIVSRRLHFTLNAVDHV